MPAAISPEEAQRQREEQEERQRQLREEQERRIRQRRLRLEEKRAREAAELHQRQESFEEGKQAALQELKGDAPAASASPGAFGLKGVDTPDSGLKRLHAEAAPVFRTAAGQLHCAASIARKEFSAAARPDLRAQDLQKIRFYADQARNALGGRPVQGGCEAADSPLVFHKSIAGYKETYSELQDMIVEQAEVKVHAVEDRPKLQRKAQEARAKVQELEGKPEKEDPKLALEKARAALKEAERAEEDARAAEKKADEALAKLQQAEEKITKEPEKADELFDQMFGEKDGARKGD